MNRLALVGYGRMGKLVEQLAPGHGFEVVARLDSSDHEIDERFREVDVAVDFSTAAAVPGTVERLAPLGVPLVVGTTGWHEALPRVREAVERHGSGFLHDYSLPCARRRVSMNPIICRGSHPARRIIAAPALSASRSSSRLNFNM